MDIPKPTYTVAAKCTNCGYVGKVTVDSGKSAPDMATCPKCENYTFKVIHYYY